MSAPSNSNRSTGDGCWCDDNKFGTCNPECAYALAADQLKLLRVAARNAVIAIAAHEASSVQRRTWPAVERARQELQEALGETLAEVLDA